MMTTFDLDSILADALVTDGPSEESSEPDSALEAMVRLSEDRAAVFTPGGTHDEDDRLISEDFYELMVDPTASEQKAAQPNQPMMMPPMALGGRGAEVPVGGGRPMPGSSSGTGAGGAAAVGAGSAAVGAGGAAGSGSFGSVPGLGGLPGGGASGSLGSGSLGSGGLGSGGLGSPLAGSAGTSAAGVDSTGSPYDTGTGRSGLAAPTPSALDTDRSAGTNTAGMADGVGSGLHDRVSSGPVDSGPGAASTTPYGAGTSMSPSAGSAPFDAGSPSGMPTGAELGGGVPSGGAPPSMPAGGASGGAGLGGTGLGGGAAPTTNTRKWSIEDLAADGQLWDQLAQSHDRTVVADRILTEPKAQSGVIGPASTNIRVNLLKLERLADEAHVAMTEIADLLKLTARTKSETEADNTAAAARTIPDEPQLAGPAHEAERRHGRRVRHSRNLPEGRDRA